MSTTSEATLDQALALARRLSPHDRAMLIGRLAQELAAPVPLPAVGDAWAQWAALREEIRSAYPDARLGERLEADRRERDESLRSTHEADDVHP